MAVKNVGVGLAPTQGASARAVALPERVSFARIPDIRPMPGLIQIQLDSFEWFKKEGLHELFEEISPIEDFTGKNLSLEFIVPPEPFGKSKYSEDECRDRDATYSAPLTVKLAMTSMGGPNVFAPSCDTFTQIWLGP